MSVRLTIANSSKETGALLRQYLQHRNAYNERSSTIVCYGQPASGRRVLNSNCGTDKIVRMHKMGRAGVLVVPWFSDPGHAAGSVFPLLARKSTGFGGTDIVPVFQAEEIPWRIQAGWDWFSEYIPVETEYRVWVFQEQLLDVYEKTMQRPAEFKFIGRNFRNGFEFQVALLRGGAISATDQAFGAVRALELDFGAVDILLGKDGRCYVLEVNTAPGVLRSHAEPTLAKLADKIVEWDGEAR